MLQKAYGINAVKTTHAYVWYMYRRFKDGQDDSGDRPKSGWPTSITLRHVVEI